jgi:AGCS family alanine or glycine:cation symporter
MQTLKTAIGIVSGYAWGWPTMILLMGTGLYLTFLLRGLQFRKLPHAFSLIFKKDPDSEGDITHFGALMTALAATVGNGNIVGVAGAILLGGPGAIFWMWMIGLVGMATKYAEAVLAVRYREHGPYGMRGGPMYYISRGAGLPWLGTLFAIFAAIAAFGIGNMTQANAVAGNVHDTFGVNPGITGLVLTVLSAAVILGGIRSISRFSSILVPIMIVGYCAAAILILMLNVSAIPAALGLIFKYAFTPYAAGGGFFGAVINETMRYGLARGIFSNESGLGSSPIAAAAAKTKDPATQALVSMTQTFIDTIVVCTMTALVILITTHWQDEGMAKNVLTSTCFSDSLGRAGAIVVTLASATFAYSTIIGWCYYGEKAVEYLAGPKSIWVYRVLFVMAINVGTVVEMDWFQNKTNVTDGVNMIWDTADVMNALMAIPNLIGLLLLAKIVKQETDAYFGKNTR